MSDSSRHDAPKLDEAQFSVWHGQFAGDLRAFLCGVLKDPEAADEALQRTWVKLWQAGTTVEPGKIRGWLFQVAYREALQLRRSRQLQTRKLAEWVTLKRIQQQSTNDPVAQELIDHEEQVALKAALETLPEEQRQVVRQRLGDDRTFQQIADEQFLPLGTVLTRMRLAMAKLQKIFKRSE